MADAKGSALPAGGVLSDSTRLFGLDGGANKTWNAGQVASFTRQNLMLPVVVATAMGAALFASTLAANNNVQIDRGGVITLTATAHRLTQPATGTLDLNGSKLLFNYADSTANTNFNATNVRNGTIEIGAGFNIYRLLRIQQDDGRLDDVTVQAGSFIVNGASTNDAAIRVEGNRFSSRNLVMKNMRNGCMVLGQNAYFENPQFYGMTKGLIGRGGSAVVDGLVFDGTGSTSTTDPGHNAITGEWRDLRASRFSITVVGEHGIYVAGGGKTLNQRVSFVDGDITRTGQCSFKAKDYTWVHAFDIRAAYTSYGNTPGLNEEGFRFQRNGLVTGGALNVTKDIVDGVEVGNAGFSHIFLSGNDTVRLLIESYGRGCGQGVVFGVDDSDAAIPHGNSVIRVRHDNLLGPSVVIEDGAIINGLNIVFVELDGCATSPVLIGEGVTYGPNGKLLVIGTYKGCALPPPASTANVDLSMFVPFGEVNIVAGNIANAYFAANDSTRVFQPIQTAVIDITTPALLSGLGGVHVNGASLGTPALGELTTGLSLSRKGSNRRGALIAGKLTGTDVNQMGVAVLTKSSTTPASSAVVERVVIDHLGNTYPGADNGQTFGTTTMRWSTGYFNALKNSTPIVIPFGTVADPSYAQHSTAGSGSAFVVSRWLANTAGPQVILAKSRGATVGTFTALASGDRLGDLQWWGDNGAAMAVGSQIRAEATEAWSGTANGTRITLSAVAPTTTTLTEIARLEPATGLSMFGANPVIDANRLFRTRPYTVATLPTVGTSDRLCSVTDASAPTWNVTLAGGGAVRCLAYDNGTNWTAH